MDLETTQKLLAFGTEHKLTVCSCESLTAGLFCDTIASVPGASAVLKGGLVTYFTAMKETLAHVDAKLIENYGVVSKECAAAMAKNTRQIMDADYCVSFTGNAGPSVMEGKPAGCVYCAIAGRNQIWEYHFQYQNIHRNELRMQVVDQMIQELLLRMENEHGKKSC
jgi:PncC family amidohydrolase